MNNNLFDLIRSTVPNKIAEDIVSVQPMDITPEQLNEACEVIAALHNLNQPDDEWPTSLVAVKPEEKAAE